MMLKHNSRTNYRIYGHFLMKKAAKEMSIMSPSYRIQSTCNKQCTFFMITLHNTYNILGAPSKKTGSSCIFRKGRTVQISEKQPRQLK
ncbi:hypothetical protein O997_04000 [Anaplasma phagocytophilum str. MRK]|nr:hypothetical protein O997_04000 [Anaplasma phagocytophilum str. MRK]